MILAPARPAGGRPDGYLDFFNRTGLEYVGLPLQDLQGWKWTAAIHPDDVTELVEKWRDALATGRRFEHEARVRRADGEYRRQRVPDWAVREAQCAATSKPD
jgi:PAS domain S-box-containing protein